MKTTYGEYQDEFFKAISSSPLLSGINREQGIGDIINQVDRISKAHYVKNNMEWEDPWLLYARGLMYELLELGDRVGNYHPRSLVSLQKSVSKHFDDWLNDSE